MKNLYEVLAISPSATIEEVKSAYRRCARVAHPDHKGDAEHFRLVQEAYAVLGDAEKRAAYDQERRLWMRKIGAVECHACGSANRITHRPEAGEIARCARCKTQLRITLSDMMSAQRQSLLNETARFVDEVGFDLAELAADAVKSGIGRLRQRLGLRKSERTAKLKP